MLESMDQAIGNIDQPLLVFGEEENAHPPSWLSPYLESLPLSKKERKQSTNNKRNSI